MSSVSPLLLIRSFIVDVSLVVTGKTQFCISLVFNPTNSMEQSRS
jgi:hypothetical protein